MWTSPDISIHAPVKGATIISNQGHDLRVISIHAPVKGATGGYQGHVGFLGFQSTLP